MYSSLYPSIILENNLAPNTQIGFIDIPDKVHDMEHRDMYSSDDDDARYVRGGEFLENMMSGNILEFCHRWLGLGDIHDTIGDIKEYFKFNEYYGRPIEYRYNDGIYKSKSIKRDGLIFNTYSQVPGIKLIDELSKEYKEDLIDKIRNVATL